MNAVILGAAGQLGEELSRQLPSARALKRSDLDVTDAVAMRSILTAAAPEVVFNATSNNRVDAAQGDPTPAFAVNALAVRELACICRDLGCRLVHFSTNYVFGGDRLRTIPYREDDRPAPINAYGVSKLIGERFAAAYCPEHLIIRTSAMFGWASGSRNNFLENMLARAKSDGGVRIVNDQTVAPTLASDLAAAAIRLASAKANGVFHVNGHEATTWHELARSFLELAGVGDQVRPVSSAELGAPAPRPSYSVLAIDKYLALGFPSPLRWHEAVAAYWSQRSSSAATR